MELLFILAPGIISTSLLEKLRKQRFSVPAYLKHMIVLDLFSNFLCVFFYQYIYRGVGSILESFNTNIFLMRFVILNTLFSIVLSVGYFLLSPKVDIQSNNMDKEEESDHE